MNLFVRHIGDPPHLQNPDRPAQTICRKPLLGAKQITAAQALVWLGDQRCTVCDPSHKYQVLRKAS